MERIQTDISQRYQLFDNAEITDVVIQKLIHADCDPRFQCHPFGGSFLHLTSSFRIDSKILQAGRRWTKRLRSFS